MNESISMDDVTALTQRFDFVGDEESRVVSFIQDKLPEEDEALTDAVVDLAYKRLSLQIRDVHHLLTKQAKLVPSDAKETPAWYGRAFHCDGKVKISKEVVVGFLGLNPTICGFSDDQQCTAKNMFRWFVLEHLLFKFTKSIGMDYEFFLMSMINIDHWLARTTFSHLVSGDYYLAMMSVMNYMNLRLEWWELDGEKGQLTLANLQLVKHEGQFVLINVSLSYKSDMLFTLHTQSHLLLDSIY